MRIVSRMQNIPELMVVLLQVGNARFVGNGSGVANVLTTCMYVCMHIGVSMQVLHICSCTCQLMPMAKVLLSSVCASGLRQSQLKPASVVLPACKRDCLSVYPCCDLTLP